MELSSILKCRINILGFSFPRSASNWLNFVIKGLAECPPLPRVRGQLNLHKNNLPTETNTFGLNENRVRPNFSAIERLCYERKGHTKYAHEHAVEFRGVRTFNSNSLKILTECLPSNRSTHICPSILNGFPNIDVWCMSHCPPLLHIIDSGRSFCSCSISFSNLITRARTFVT